MAETSALRVLAHPLRPHPPASAVVAVAETSALRVLAHPLRLRMLSLLTGAPFSAMEPSRELSASF